MPTRLSAPVLVHPSNLKSNSGLTSQIIDLVNHAFHRVKQSDPLKWDIVTPRFPTHESYYDMLVEDAIIALIFDQNAQEENDSDEPISEKNRGQQGESGLSGKLVACAAAVPWKGRWAREGDGKEEGWEIKAVAVHGDAVYLRKGLAVQVVAELEKYLVEKKMAQLGTGLPRDTILGSNEQGGTLALWIMAAECISGLYWRKRGYREVRRRTEGRGTWGCKTNFELVVFRKDVELTRSF